MNEGRFDDRAPIESRLVSTANFPGTPARSFGEGESARASLTTPAGHAANGYADDRVRQGDLLSDSDIVGQSIAGMRALSAAGLDSASRSDPADDDPAHPPPPGGYRDRPIVEPNPQRGTGDALSAPADRANGRLAVDLEPVDRAHRDSAGARLASQAGVETQRLQALVDRTVPLRTSPFSPNGGAPVRAAGKKYTVVSGDNLYRIARKHYGVSSHHLVRAIFEANRTVLSHEDEVRIGDELFLPEVDSPRASTSPVDASVAPPLRDKPDGSSAKPARRHREPRPFRWYQVERDDRYTTIAAAQLGDARRWKELYEFNRDIFPDADRIRAGVRIRIPTVEVADARGGRR
jgi:nucleoid-associated protein YgaU